jgi:RNA polymerase sigma factor (TIGR02999 family)
MPTSPHEITHLLGAWRNGDQNALDQLVPLVYNELRQIAHRALSQQPNNRTLQTTALVHEAYLRLAGEPDVAWQNRAHFFAVAARVMRFLLVDQARARGRDKRGGGQLPIALDDAAVIAPERPELLLALDEALDRLTALDEQKSRVVEMRYFGGMSIDEVAEVLGIAPITVKREWGRAKAWLYHELSGC